MTDMLKNDVLTNDMLTNEELWNAWAALWNGDLGLGEKIFTPEFRVHFGREVPGADDVRGGVAMADLIDAFRGRFESLRYGTELGPIGDGELFAARWFADAVDGDGAWRAWGHDVLRVEGGLIAEAWSITGTLRVPA